MKKILSLFLALLLVLSLAGCQLTVSTPTDIESSPTGVVFQFKVPDLTGQNIQTLQPSENYSVQQNLSVPSPQPAGTILGQAPSKDTLADQGCTIFVIVSQGSGEQATEPDATVPVYTVPQATGIHQPVVTQPGDIRPDLPEQTDPPIPPQEEQPDTPLATDPPATKPQSVTPQVTQPQAAQPQATNPQPTGSPATQPTDPPQTLPPQTDPPATQAPDTQPSLWIDPDGSYTTKEDVALYIYLYHRLPDNFVTKRAAENQYNDNPSQYGKCIGGDRFYNREGLLPDGYTYYECDIDTLYSSKRGAKRLVFTYSGIVYYTSNHYESFTRLY